MPHFRIEALEKFVVRTVYTVTAGSPQQAVRRCRTGRVAYSQHAIEEGDEEWLRTISVEMQGRNLRSAPNRKGNRHARLNC